MAIIDYTQINILSTTFQKLFKIKVHQDNQQPNAPHQEEFTYAMTYALLFYQK